MVLVINDLEYLEAIRSPFVPVARRFPASTAGRELLESLYEASLISGVRSEQTQPDSWKSQKERVLARIGTAECHSVLSGLTRDESERLFGLGHVVSCGPEDVVLAPGEVAHELYVVLGGSFRVLGPPLMDRGGGRLVQMLAEGDVFGGAPFLTGGLHTGTVQAVQGSTMLVLSSRSLNHLAISSAALSAKLFRNLARMRAVGQRDGMAPRPVDLTDDAAVRPIDDGRHPSPRSSPTVQRSVLSTPCYTRPSRRVRGE